MMLRCQELSMFAFCVLVPSVLIIREGLLVEGIPGINLVTENAENGTVDPAFTLS